MPVSVPVNSGHYGDGTVNLAGLHAHASPGHPSVMGAPGHPGASPRPSSSSGMLDVGGNNGYPPNPSPVPDSPPPTSSSQQPGVLKSNAMVRPLSPQQPQQSTHSLVGSHIQRPSLRVVIPGPQSGLAISSHDRGNSLNTNVRILTHLLPGQAVARIPSFETGLQSWRFDSIIECDGRHLETSYRHLSVPSQINVQS